MTNPYNETPDPYANPLAEPAETISAPTPPRSERAYVLFAGWIDTWQRLWRKAGEVAQALTVSALVLGLFVGGVAHFVQCVDEKSTKECESACALTGDSSAYLNNRCLCSDGETTHRPGETPIEAIARQLVPK